jgi:NAD(P)-dependent dehydrogenase (short-subunit alcohol dehydrogenase family)
MQSLKGKTAIVTGASRGIGKAIAIKIHELGCNVVGIYKSRDDKADSLVKDFPKIKMIKADVGKEETAKKAIDETVKQFGGLDILINNAGINILGEIADYKLPDWDEMLRVDLTAKFLFSKYSIPHLKKSETGNIINISSRLGMTEYVMPETVPYGVANAGTNALTVGLARELEESKIRVNAIIPTVTDTDRFQEAFTPEEQEEVRKKGKLGKPEDVADLVVGILQDEARNGEIVIDKRVNL